MLGISDNKLSYDDIYDAVRGGHYKSNVPYPKYEKYGENHIFDENMSVKWNCEEVVRRNQAYKDALKEYYKGEQEANKKFREDLIQAIMNDTGFSYEKAEMIFGRAYDRGHSSGYYEVVSYASEIADFIYDFIRKE